MPVVKAIFKAVKVRELFELQRSQRGRHCLLNLFRRRQHFDRFVCIDGEVRLPDIAVRGQRYVTILNRISRMGREEVGYGFTTVQFLVGPKVFATLIFPIAGQFDPEYCD